MRSIAWRAVFTLVLVGGLIEPALVGPAAARPGSGGPRAVEVTTNHAKVSASSFDGGEPVQPPVTAEASDFSVFSRVVEKSDDSTSEGGRSGEAEASQTTTVDTSDEDVTSVDSLGDVSGTWNDATPSDGNDPFGRATSEFTVTFDVTDRTFFSVSGVLTATADAASIECTTIKVTSPDGTTFDVAAPSGCGAPPDLSILDTGRLQPGTYTFSVVANAQAFNPAATGGSAEAFFDVGLNVGCTITGTSGADTLSGTAERDMICGLGGADTIDGGDGSDFILGGNGGNVIRGGEGEDRIVGGEDSDTIFGGEDSDFIVDDGGSDQIQGGGGNDEIHMFGAGADQIVGDNPDCETASSPPGSNDDKIFGSDGNDQIFGCQGLDKILGLSGDDEIFGNSGNDVLNGGTGSDKLHGNDGSDTLTGEARKDVLLGDGGNDTLFANDGVFDVVGGGPGGGDEAKIDEGIDTVTGVEVLL